MPSDAPREAKRLSTQRVGGGRARYGSCSNPGVFKLFLISVVLIPVWLAVRAASGRRGARPLAVLLALVGAYDVSYLLMLYYLHLRWVGWGAAGP